MHDGTLLSLYYVVLCCGFRGPPPCGVPLGLVGCYPLFLLFCDQKSSRKVPLLPRRGARLKGNGSRVARAALRAVSLKNPRADGLAPARGQHSTISRCKVSIICCLFSFGCRGRRPRRPVQSCVTTQLQGGVKPPPYGTNGEKGVGANSVRPGSWAATQDCTGGYGIRPYGKP